MPIDASIAMGFKQPQFESPVNSLANIMQLQGAQSANQLNQMKIEALGQDAKRTNALQSLLSGEYATPEARQSAMIKGGFLKEASDYGKSNSDAADAASKRKTEELTQANKRIDLAGSVFGFVRQNPTPENAFAALDHLASNGIYSPEQVNEYKAKIQANPQGVAQMADMAFRGALSAKEQLLKNDTVSAGDRVIDRTFDPVSGKVAQIGTTAIGQSADSKASERSAAAGRAVTMRGQDMTNARALEANQSGKAPAGYRWAADGKSMEAISGGPADLKNSAASNQKVNEAKDVLSLLDEVDALLPKATGSYLGAGVDSVAGAVGYGTKGAESGAQLKALEGALISKMPKMSGPQSDKDVLLYKQMAGQIGDPTIPVNTRKAASKLIRKLNEKYAGVSSSGSLDSLLDKYK